MGAAVHRTPDFRQTPGSLLDGDACRVSLFAPKSYIYRRNVLTFGIAFIAFTVQCSSTYTPEIWVLRKSKMETTDCWQLTMLAIKKSNWLVSNVTDKRFVQSTSRFYIYFFLKASLFQKFLCGLSPWWTCEINLPALWNVSSGCRGYWLLFCPSSPPPLTTWFTSVCFPGWNSTTHCRTGGLFSDQQLPPLSANNV